MGIVHLCFSFSLSFLPMLANKIEGWEMKRKFYCLGRFHTIETEAGLVSLGNTKTMLAWVKQCHLLLQAQYWYQPTITMIRVICVDWYWSTLETMKEHMNSIGIGADYPRRVLRNLVVHPSNKQLANQIHCRNSWDFCWSPFLVLAGMFLPKIIYLIWLDLVKSDKFIRFSSTLMLLD